MPGTSGAPVFVTLSKGGSIKEYLFGIVTSYSSLSGHFQTFRGEGELNYILGHATQTMGSYQTIFASLYREQAATKQSDQNYRLDPEFISCLQQIQASP
ncbi:MAG: hypothetical protein NTX76_06445 [Alphaproteobacteria bacterium]|nr:hypothetical protein [Alphaproteobacteria bacterium]